GVGVWGRVVCGFFGGWGGGGGGGGGAVNRQHFGVCKDQLTSQLPVLAQLSLLGWLYDAFRNRFGGECLTRAPAQPKPRTSATSSDAPAVKREAEEDWSKEPRR